MLHFPVKILNTHSNDMSRRSHTNISVRKPESVVKYLPKRFDNSNFLLVHNPRFYRFDSEYLQQTKKIRCNNVSLAMIFHPRDSSKNSCQIFPVLIKNEQSFHHNFQTEFHVDPNKNSSFALTEKH